MTCSVVPGEEPAVAATEPVIGPGRPGADHHGTARRQGRLRLAARHQPRRAPRRPARARLRRRRQAGRRQHVDRRVRRAGAGRHARATAPARRHLGDRRVARRDVRRRRAHRRRGDDVHGADRPARRAAARRASAAAPGHRRRSLHGAAHGRDGSCATWPASPATRCWWCATSMAPTCRRSRRTCSPRCARWGRASTCSRRRGPPQRRMAMLDFAEQWRHDDELQRGCVILRYHIPFTGEREWARTYKVALREVNAHSIVNAGLRVRFDADGTVAEAARGVRRDRPDRVPRHRAGTAADRSPLGRQHARRCARSGAQRRRRADRRERGTHGRRPRRGLHRRVPHAPRRELPLPVLRLGRRARRAGPRRPRDPLGRRAVAPSGVDRQADHPDVRRRVPGQLPVRQDRRVPPSHRRGALHHRRADPRLRRRGRVRRVHPGAEDVLVQRGRRLGKPPPGDARRARHRSAAALRRLRRPRHRGRRPRHEQPGERHVSRRSVDLRRHDDGVRPGAGHRAGTTRRRRRSTSPGGCNSTASTTGRSPGTTAVHWSRC